MSVCVLFVYPKTIKQINRGQCTFSTYFVITKTADISVLSIARRVSVKCCGTYLFVFHPSHNSQFEKFLDDVLKLLENPSLEQ